MLLGVSELCDLNFIETKYSCVHDDRIKNDYKRTACADSTCGRGGNIKFHRSGRAWRLLCIRTLSRRQSRRRDVDKDLANHFFDRQISGFKIAVDTRREYLFCAGLDDDSWQRCVHFSIDFFSVGKVVPRVRPGGRNPTARWIPSEEHSTEWNGCLSCRHSVKKISGVDTHRIFKNPH